MNAIQMSRVVNGKRYDTEKATLIAHDVYWDGHNMERHGRNTFLYKTAKGNYFTVNRTMWQGEEDTLNPVAKADAKALFESYLREHEVSWEEAFGETPEEA